MTGVSPRDALPAARSPPAITNFRRTAELSRQMFRVQHRERWRAHAALVVLQLGTETGPGDPELTAAGWSFAALGA